MTVSLAFNFYVSNNSVSPEMGRIGDDAVKMAAKTKAAGLSFSQLGTALKYAGIAAAAGEAVALVDALAPMTGLLAAVPAVALAGATSVVALAVGFHGLTAALKTSASSGGVSADQLASAQHRIAQAELSATAAERGLSDARETAAKKLRDLTLQTEEANLAVSDSELAVKDAQLSLNQARQQGDPLAIQHAENALAEAQLNVVEAQNRASDTQEEYNKRQQQGVEGSDEVQQALQHQADSTYELAQAQKALNGGGGGSDASAVAYAKLAPAAKLVVDVLKSLAPAWKQVQQATQQSLFVGAAADIRTLGATYLPILRVQLAGVASGWNGAFHQTAQLAATPGFVRDTAEGLNNTATFAKIAGQALAPVVDGLRQFGVVGSQYLPRLAGFIKDTAVGFDRWATAARDSGKISSWIATGTLVAQKFWMIVLSLGGAIRNVFHAGDAGPNFLDTLVKGAAAFASWTASAQGQSQLKEFFGSLRDVASQLWGIIKSVGTAFIQAGPGISTASAYLSVGGAVVKVLADNMNLLRPLLPFLLILFATWKIYTTNVKIAKAATDAFKAAQVLLNATMLANPIGLIVAVILGLIVVFVLLWNKSAGFRDFWKGLWKDIQGAAQAAWGFLVAGFDALKKALSWSSLVGDFKWAMNGIIGLLDQAIHHINSGIIDSVNHLSGLIGIPAIPHIPDIPKLATGGHVLRTGLALIHEGEDVVPAAQVRTNGPTVGRNNGPVAVSITVDGTAGKLEQAVIWIIKNHARVVGGKGPDSVQKAFGQ